MVEPSYMHVEEGQGAHNLKERAQNNGVALQQLRGEFSVVACSQKRREPNSVYGGRI